MYPQIVKTPRNDSYNWIIQFVGFVETHTNNHDPQPTKGQADTPLGLLCAVTVAFPAQLGRGDRLQQWQQHGKAQSEGMSQPGRRRRGWVPGRRRRGWVQAVTPVPAARGCTGSRVPGAPPGQKESLPLERPGEAAAAAHKSSCSSAQIRGQRPKPGTGMDAHLWEVVSGREDTRSSSAGGFRLPRSPRCARYVNPCLGSLLCSSHQMVLYIQTWKFFILMWELLWPLRK